MPDTGLPPDSVSATLDQLAVSTSARVLRISCGRPEAIRLMELGLLPNTRVTVVRRAPMGDPIELRLRGYSLSLRASEACQITVEPTG